MRLHDAGYRVSVERVSVNQLTETTLRGKLTTSHKEEPKELSRTVPPACPRWKGTNRWGSFSMRRQRIIGRES